MIFQFASTKQATAFYRQLYVFTVRCRTVTASFHGTVRLTTQSLKKTHLGKLPAFLAKQTLFATGFASTINDTFATVSGTDVLFIGSVGHHPPTAGPDYAVQNLVTRILHLGPRIPAGRPYQRTGWPVTRAITPKSRSWCSSVRPCSSAIAATMRSTGPALRCWPWLVSSPCTSQARANARSCTGTQPNSDRKSAMPRSRSAADRAL